MSSEVAAVSDPVETPEVGGRLPRLGEDEIAELSEHGRRRQMEPGDVLIREGQRDRDFVVVLSGTVAVYEGYGTPEQQLVRLHGPGRFLDEIGLLIGQPAFVSSVAYEPGEVLVVPLPALREVVAADPKLGDLILRALVCRRELLVGTASGIRIIGSRFSPDTRRLREFAARNRLPHTWIDCDEDAGAEELLRQLGIRAAETPVVIWRNEHVLRNPSNADLARLLGLPPPGASGTVCDLVVVGAGPAGLAAAVYGASEGLTTVVIDAVAAGGQAGTSTRIENYLGFPGGISGAELAERAILQAKKFGARLQVPSEAAGFCRQDDHYRVRLSGDEKVDARTVVIATGARYRTLEVARIEELTGLGVYYAATPMEADMCAGSEVAIVGGGNSAGQAAVFLSRKVRQVTLMCRGPDLTRTMSRYLIDQIDRVGNIEVRTRTQVSELIGDRALEALMVSNGNGKLARLDVKALFVFIGADPRTGWLTDEVLLDGKGFVLTGAELAAATDVGAAQPLALETSAPGVFAVGDVRSASIKRVASAVGEGSMAVRLVHQHLAEV